LAGVVFFKGLGTINNPFLIQLITTHVNSCSTPVSFWMVERFGRRRILLIGGSCMAISQLIVGIIGVTVGKRGDPTAVRCMISFICVNISMFIMTWGPAAWIIVGEIFPLTIRSRGVGLSTASNWFWNCVEADICDLLGNGH
jgi:MFS family permease